MRRDLPKVIEESFKVDVESTQPKKKKKKVTFNDKAEEWTLQLLAKYFEYLYQTKFNKPYLPKKGDLKQLKRLKEVKGNDTIKYYMETFMELDYFEIKTLRIFCSNYTQTVLDHYIESGSLPSKTKSKDTYNEPEPTESWKETVDQMYADQGYEDLEQRLKDLIEGAK